jgi:small GTP-binding protein
MEQDEDFSEIFKIVLIGAANVGKTALVFRYVIIEAPSSNTATVGVEFTKKVITDKESGKKYQLHIWDTAGQERYKSVTKHHYRAADGCIIVYDIANKDSYDEVPHWYEELDECTGAEDGCVVALVGNKVDLEQTKGRTVAKDTARKFAESNHMLYYETSSFWDQATPNSQSGPVEICGISHVFEKVVQAIMGRRTSREEAPSPAPKDRSGRAKLKLDSEQILSYHAENRCAC